MELVGERVGPYEIVAELGVGGMGVVYRATDEGGRPVALKMLHPHLLAARSAFKRFLREAELGKEIVHPNVVRTLDIDALLVRDRHVHFLVMEYVEGQTLDKLVRELGTVPEELCRHIGRQIANALAAIHAKGAIHRDLKPANVIITPDHEVKVMDLGVALLVERSLRLTDAGEFLGSVLYAAPEQWNPDAVLDPRIDLFALGILLYELSTGSHPFAAGGKGLPPSLVTSRAPTSLRVLRPELSEFFGEFVTALLAIDPEDRPGTASLVQGILETGERSQWWLGRHAELERAGRIRAREIHVPHDAALHGRDEEIARLNEAMEIVRTGRGQVVLIEGESGIGKTRLVDEFVRRQTGPAKFLFGSYLPGATSAAEGALSTAFRDHFGRVELEAKLAALLPELSALVPAFAALLRGEAPSDERKRLTPESIATVIAETTRGLAKDEPVVLFLDDLHNAPLQARRIFAGLARAIADHPVLLLGAVRQDADGEWSTELRALDYVQRISLPRLSPGDLSKLLVDALGSTALADQLGWEIARKSDGNPFYVFEILRDLRERKKLVRTEDGNWKTTGIIRQIETPHSVRDLVHARLRDLDDEDRDLLDMAACLGQRFDPSIVAEACGISLIPALKRFRRLERDHSLLRPEGREYVFDQHQIREAIYADLFEQLREEYHARIGEVCEQSWRQPTGAQALALCRHFLAGRAADRATPYLRDAIQVLRAGCLYESLRALAGQALDAGEPKDEAERFEVLAAAAEGCNLCGDWQAEGRHVDEMLAIAGRMGDEKKRCLSLIRKGNQLYSISEFEASSRAYEEAKQLAEGLQDRLLEEAAVRGLGINHSRTGRNEAALVCHRRSLALSREFGSPAHEAGAESNVALLHVALNRLDEAESHYRRAIELARAAGERRWEANAYANYGRIHFLRGDYDRAWECATRYREIVRLIGDRRGEATSGIILGALWTIFGALEEMEHELARSEIWIEETKDRWLSGYALRQRAWIAHQRDDLAEADRLYRATLALRREIGDGNSIPDTLVEHGTVLVRLGRAGEARARFEEALASKDAEESLRAAVLSEFSVIEPDRIPEARTALARAAPRGELSVSAPHCFWLGGGDPADLEAAHAALRDLQARIPPEYRRRSIENVRVFRAVEEAWSQRRA